MITNAKEICGYLDGGTLKIEYVEDGVKKICFIDYSLDTQKPGAVYENMYGSKFYKELNSENSTVIKALLGIK